MVRTFTIWGAVGLAALAASVAIAQSDRRVFLDDVLEAAPLHVVAEGICRGKRVKVKYQQTSRSRYSGPTVTINDRGLSPSDARRIQDAVNRLHERSQILVGVGIGCSTTGHVIVLNLPLTGAGGHFSPYDLRALIVDGEIASFFVSSSRGTQQVEDFLGDAQPKGTTK